MDTAEDGEEIGVEEIRAWSALSPTRGQVVEVYIPGTDLESPPEVWAAFIITQVVTRLDGSLVLTARHLGCEDKTLGKALDSRFNSEDCQIHLCLSTPCIDTGVEGDALPDACLHAIKIRLWTRGGFEENNTYVTAARMKNASKWLDTGPPKPAGRRRAAAPKKGPGKPDAAREAAPKPLIKKRATEGKMSAADREALRDKLRLTRQRLQGAEGGRKKPTAGDGAELISDEDASAGYSPGSSNYVEDQDGLDTGTALVAPRDELAEAVALKKRKQKKKGGDHSDLYDLATVSRGNTSKTLSGQLVQRALEMTQSQKDKRKKKERHKKSGAHQLTQVLTKILTKSQDTAEDSKDQKKKKRRKLKDGTIISCSESCKSSSYDGSDEESSETDLEAPLRKKSRDKPGSVLNLLVAHVREQLDQGALTNVSSTRDQMTGGVKVMSYFNLSVRGSYPTYIRELREMHHLAACIDLIRTGDIARAADGMSARFIALHQSLVDGSWTTARHLELHPMEESSAAGPAAILATRRHAKLVAKVQGYATSSWGTPNYRGNKGGKGKGEWTYQGSPGEQRGDQKGKGKGKKGKSKWEGWENRPRKDWGKDKEKPEEKPKG